MRIKFFGFIALVCIIITACGGPKADKVDWEFKLDRYYSDSIMNGRTYSAYIPSTFNRTDMMVLLHGAYGSGQTISDTSKMNVLAKQHGFMTVYPDGVQNMWNAGECCGYPARAEVGDVGFIWDLITSAKQKYPIKNVYIVGFSNGGMMAYRLACEMPSLITAIAVVSGTLVYEGDCSRANMPILHIHGTDDKLVPFNGGKGLLSGVEYRSVPDTIAAFPNATLRIVEGSGHEWLDWASATIWEFMNGN